LLHCNILRSQLSKNPSPIWLQVINSRFKGRHHWNYFIFHRKLAWHGQRVRRESRASSAGYNVVAAEGTGPGPQGSAASSAATSPRCFALLRICRRQFASPADPNPDVHPIGTNAVTFGAVSRVFDRLAPRQRSGFASHLAAPVPVRVCDPNV
jgi:hypothetical protein